jgi:hypothetical protein
MEVASPLPFSAQAGNKRRFASCSPILDTNATSGMVEVQPQQQDDFMMDDQPYGRVKRRRCGSVEPNGIESSSPFLSAAVSNQQQPGGKLMSFGSPQNRIGFSTKRQRTEEEPTSQTTHLTQIIANQKSQIEHLTTEKSNLLTSYNELKTSHEKTSHENIILKKSRHDSTRTAESSRVGIERRSSV